MARLQAAYSGLIDAPADVVYEIIADYRDTHPRILPRENFRDLRIEQGGRGAGTIISFISVSGGRERPFRMEISEPDPGRVLVERDTASTLTTTFTVTPVDGGRRANVEIVTAWDQSQGLAGLLERIAYPPALRRIYARELRQLAAVAAEKAGVQQTSSSAA